MTAVFGGLDVGSAIGLLLCGPLIHWFGWQSVFYLFAVLGLVWCLLWPLCRPEMQDSSESLEKVLFCLRSSRLLAICASAG